jgi:hypothetical protein
MGRLANSPHNIAAPRLTLHEVMAEPGIPSRDIRIQRQSEIRMNF